jgi:hypothetical protein
MFAFGPKADALDSNGSTEVDVRRIACAAAEKPLLNYALNESNDSAEVAAERIAITACRRLAFQWPLTASG